MVLWVPPLTLDLKPLLITPHLSSLFFLHLGLLSSLDQAIAFHAPKEALLPTSGPHVVLLFKFLVFCSKDQS